MQPPVNIHVHISAYFAHNRFQSNYPIQTLIELVKSILSLFSIKVFNLLFYITHYVYLYMCIIEYSLWEGMCCEYSEHICAYMCLHISKNNQGVHTPTIDPLRLLSPPFLACTLRLCPPLPFHLPPTPKVGCFVCVASLLPLTLCVWPCVAVWLCVCGLSPLSVSLPPSPLSPSFHCSRQRYTPKVLLVTLTVCTTCRTCFGVTLRERRYAP